MSPRKPTIDQTDDVDDQDGTLEEDVKRADDLSLEVRNPDEVALGGSQATEQLNSRLRDLEEEDLEEESPE